MIMIMIKHHDYCNRGEKHTDSTLAGEYAQTKLFNIMTAFELDHRFSSEGVDGVACQPGESCQPPGV